MDAPAAPPATRPLCVDLDGTLLATDALWESLLILLKRRPWTLLLLPAWLLRGKARLKREIARRVALNLASLPYREDVLSFLRREKASGRELILVTASDRRLAESISRHLDLFSAVLASDGRTNLSGRQKLEVLQRHIGGREFDYVGNARADLPVWEAASEALLVHPSPRLLRQALKVGAVGKIFGRSANRLRDFWEELRVHQWVKNFLLFVPLIGAHKVGQADRLLLAICAFFSFSLCASSIYVVNDLLDLEADRHHPRKKFRPFAAGRLPLWTGALLAPLLLGGSFVLAASLHAPLFLAALGLYVLIATAYSFYLKRALVVDVLVLAGLYTLRVLAGGVATDIPVSPWLLVFSMFLFLSLAFVKRYSELGAVEAGPNLAANGRSYVGMDRELLRITGPASGYLSVLVLALYVNSKEVTALYQRPQVLWGVCPLLLYWITRIWFLAHRGEMKEDPVVFAVMDPASYVVGALVVLLVLAAL